MRAAIGPCTPREVTGEEQVTIVQDVTLASANGGARRPCSTTQLVRFVIPAQADPGKPAFVAGPAQVCGTGITRAQGQILDIDTCAFVTLVNP